MSEKRKDFTTENTEEPQRAQRRRIIMKCNRQSAGRKNEERA
jgi:hypothetical protein